MKSSRKKRILATILCMVMVLTSNISALAEGDDLPDMTDQGVAASVSEAPVPDAEVPTVETQAVTEQPVQTPAEPVEVPTTPEVTPEPTPEVTTAPAPETEPVPTQEQPAGTTETTVSGTTDTSTEEQGNTTENGAEISQPTTDTTVPTPEVTPEAEGEVFSEETELTQEFRDEKGQLIQKVTAKLPAGAFAAETSHITMEVQYLDTASENHIKNLMMKQLPEGDELGDYITLSVKFKVDGVETDSLQPIDITFEKSGLEITDTKKANVFYYDPADPTVAGDQDELVEITQRNEMIERLQAAGQSTDHIEDYDLSSIEIKEENRSEKIQFEGRKSTIYGCYVEKTPEQVSEEIPVLNYEDDQVAVSVTAEEAGVIPEGAELRVLPITSEDAETKEQYQEVEKKIKEKVAEEEKEVAGFLAYDITFTDKDGNKMEPNGKVKVSMNYKKAELPQEVEEKKATDAEVTVLHLEEDEKGEVKQVVDMSEQETTKVDTIFTTNGPMVKNVAVETESFSVYSIVWGSSTNKKVVFHYVDEKGVNILEGDDSEIRYNSDNRSEIPLAIKHIEGYVYQKNYITFSGNRIEDIESLEYSERNLYYLKNGEPKKIGEIQVDVYLVYDTDTDSSTSGGADPLTAPEHNKYIRYNGGDDYTLTLDVKGTKTSDVGADVLFVLDISGSMDTNKLITPLKNQVEKFAKKLLDKEGNVNRMAAVTFSSDKFTNNQCEQTWTTDSTTLIKNICGQKYFWNNSWHGGLDAGGGTNWQSAMIKAENILKADANNLNKKYVIFISDGEPTYRYEAYKTEKLNPRSEVGAGDTDDGRNFDAAVGQFELSPTLRKTEMYAMYLTNGTQVAMEKFADAVGVHKANGIGGNFDGTMDQIADSILYNAYENVSINDTLSEYVEFADTPDWQVLKNGVPLDSVKYELDTNLPTKSFSLKIKEELAKDAVYSVSVHVKPSLKAYYQYYTSGYNATGENQTDAPGNSTSARKEGFRANAHTGDDGRAVVSYKEKANAGQKFDTYMHPVVQVNDQRVEHSVIKRWENPDAMLDSVQVQLKAFVTIGNAEQELTNETYMALPENMLCNLSTDNWRYSWDNLPKYYYYMIDDVVQQPVEIRYTVEEIQDENNKDFYGQIEESQDGKTTIITNKKKDEPDASEIKVSKTFEGLTKEKIQELEENFKITIEKQDDDSIRKELTLKDSDVVRNENPDGTITYTWILYGFSEGTYIVSETGEILEGYELTYQINGKPVIVGEKGEITITQPEILYAPGIDQTPCNNTKNEVGKVNLIVAKLTEREGYFVWTKEKISINERLAIVELISSKNGMHFQPQADMNNCFFFSGNGINDSLIFRNGEIKYDGEQYLTFDGSKQWSMFATGNYEIVGGDSAEIDIKNIYKELSIDLDIKKATTNGTSIDGAEFDLYKYVDGAWVINKNGIQVKNDNTVELPGLLPGRYKLIEVKAPDSCVLLENEIYFKVENQKVILTNAEGSEISEKQDMWEVLKEENQIVLKVKNEMIYELPSTGGPGIFVYTIGGTLLLMAAALLIYKMKREEVLKG